MPSLTITPAQDVVASFQEECFNRYIAEHEYFKKEMKSDDFEDEFNDEMQSYFHQELDDIIQYVSEEELEEIIEEYGGWRSALACYICEHGLNGQPLGKLPTDREMVYCIVANEAERRCILTADAFKDYCDL